MQRVYPPTPHAEPIRRTAFDMLALFLLLSFFAVIAMAALWGFWHTSRIFTGVTVGGVPIGGMTRAEAFRQLNGELYDFPLPPVSIVYNGKQWPLETTQVNAQADLLGAVNKAYLLGRSGNLPQDLADQLAAALGRAEITPQLVIDSDALRSAVENIAAGVARPAMAERRLGDVVVAAVDGVTVDVDATLQAVLSSLRATSLHDMAQVPLVTQSTAAPAVPVVLAPVETSSSRQQPLLLPRPALRAGPGADARRHARLAGRRGAAHGGRSKADRVRGRPGCADRPAGTRCTAAFQPGHGRRDGALAQRGWPRSGRCGQRGGCARRPAHRCDRRPGWPSPPWRPKWI